MAGSEKLVISDLVLKLTGISKGFFSGQTYWLLVFGDSKLLLTIGSCFSVHHRAMEHAGSLESTKEA